MVVKLSTLRVSAEMDASGYQRGAQQKVAADGAMVASGRAVDTKISGTVSGIERLTRAFVPGYSEAMKFEAAQRTLARALDTGNVTTERAAAILQGLFAKYGLLANAEELAANGQHALAAAASAANASLAANSNNATRAATANRSLSVSTGNIAAQFQDIGVQLAGGQSPFLIALQQGTQLSAALGEGRGLKGTLSALAGGFASILSPVSLLTVGVIAFGGVALQAISSLIPKTETATEALKRHQEAVTELVHGYDAAEKAASDYFESAGRRPVGAITSDLQKQFADMNKEAIAFYAYAGKLGPALSSSLNATDQQVGALLTSFAKGERSAADLITKLTELRNTDLGPLGFTVQKFLIDPLIDAAAKARQVEDALVNLSHISVGTAVDTNLQFALDSETEASRSAQAHKLELEAIRAKTPAQLADIARRREALELDGKAITESLRKQKIQEAGELAYAQAEAAAGKAAQKSYNQQEEAAKNLRETMADRVAQAEMEAEALGLTEDAAHRLRVQFELLQQAKQAGVTLSPDEVQQYVDKLVSAEDKVKATNEALAQQKRIMDQLAGSAQSVVSALLDATGMSSTPFGSAVNGALGSLLHGDWIGAIIGGITGLITGFAQAAAEAEKARKALADASYDLDAFFRESVGDSMTEAEQAIHAFEERGQQFIALAEAAGDQAMVARINEAIEAYRNLINATADVSGGPTVEQAQAWVDSRRAALQSAYQKEASALQGVIDTAKRAIETLRNFKNSLQLGEQSPLSPFDMMMAAKATYDSTAAAALGGDQDAIAKLPDVMQAYLQTAQGYYANSAEYAAIFEQVNLTLDAALAKAEDQVDVGQQQLDALNKSVSGLIDINDSVLSVADAIRSLKDALEGLSAAGGFDAQSYWSSTLKDFYAALQDYKSTTGSATIPSAIAGVWNAFANASSATQYDQLAQMYADKLREITANYSGTSMTSSALTSSSASTILSVPSTSSGSAANSNAAVISHLKTLIAATETNTQAVLTSAQHVREGVDGTTSTIAAGNRDSSLAERRKKAA